MNASQPPPRGHTSVPDQVNVTKGDDASQQGGLSGNDSCGKIFAGVEEKGNGQILDTTGQDMKRS